MIKAIWSLVDAPLRRRFGLLVIGITVSSVWNVGGIASIMPFMRALSDPASLSDIPVAKILMDWLSISSSERFLIIGGVIVLFLFVTGNILLALVEWATVSYTRRVSYYLSTQLFTVYVSQPYAFFLNRNSSELIKNLFGETGTVAGSIVQPVMRLLAEGILSLLVVVFLIIVNPIVALVVAAVIGGGYGLFYVVLRSVLSRASNRKVRYNKERFSVASDTLGAIKEVKLRSLERPYVKRLSTSAHRLERAKAIVQTISRIPRYFLEILAFGGLLTVALIIYAGAFQTTQILPLMSVYALAGYRLMPAMQKVFAALTSIRGSKASIELLRDELSLGKDSEVPTELPERLPFQTGFSLENISFSYADTDMPSVRNITLEVASNQTIGIAGPTGCGKTTLVDVILGLLQPETGRILCDGAEISGANLRNWQANFGYVPQSIYLSDTTIARNIAFGIPQNDIDMERVRFAAQLANLDEFVESLRDGYETEIGERGVKMSGGQRQRVGIARALYQDPPILVFDEATSALDNATERVVMEAIGRLTHQKTIIMIAHRLSTLRVADMILLMDRGTAVDRGTYDELKERHPGFWIPDEPAGNETG